jgi:hypothetical protein
MKTFRDLKLIESTDEQEELINRVEQSLRNGWIRARDKEAEFKSNDGMDYRIFICSETSSRPELALFFCPDQNGYLYVCNIVPKGRELGKDGYNDVLEEFLVNFVKPGVQDLDIQIVITPAERTIDTSMSPELAQLLKQFSAAANKSSGGTHPLDERRFFDFIIQTHLEGSLLDETDLKELLVDDGWSEDNAFELSCKYRFGIDLLKHYGER